ARALLPAAAAMVWLVPVLILLATSLHGAREAATGGWRAPSLGIGSYRAVFADSGLAGSVPVTAMLALVVSGVVVALALPAAFALAWSSRTTAQVASLTLLIAAIVPIQVIAGPVTDVLEGAGVAGTLVGLGVVHVALGLPFAVLLLRNALGDLPREQMRHRRLTSHDRWWAPVKLALAPEAVPAIVAVLVLEFVQVYNDFAVGLLFSGPGVEPLGLTVYGQSRQFVANSGPLAAGCVVAALVPLALVVIARRQVVAGLVSGTIR
ncbi:MAG: ABC transporter permease subunit, partial [Acidimicrobiales bacterium]